MKLNLTAVLLLVLVLSCTRQESTTTFSIKGQVPEVYPGHVLLYKVTDLIRRAYDVVDTVTINADGSFMESYDLEPHYYVLSVYDSIYVRMIASYGQQITIEFPEDEQYVVSGSEDTEIFEKYEDFRMGILRKTVYPKRGQLYELLDKNDPNDAARIEELGKEVAAAEANYRDTLVYAVKDMGISVALYPTIVRWNGDTDMKFYEKLAEDFSQKYEGLEVTNIISEKVRIMKQISIGGKVIDITASDTTGTDLSLYENLGTYTLIDFWGSWCAPCRAESKELKSIYDKYAPAGFAIFGYAVERDSSKWVQAIDKDDRTWPNVSTLNWYSNEICAEYGITALPKNFLIDGNGVIIDRDIHGELLEARLSELLEGI